MPENQFAKNRKRVQDAFVNRGFFRPLAPEDLPLIIQEEENRNKANALQTVSISNIPVSSEQPCSYVLDVELKGKKELFSLPTGFRTVERVLMIVSRHQVHIILIEMKTSINSIELAKVDDKIKHTIGRINLLLTHYLFDNSRFDECEICYSTIIFYNRDNLSQRSNMGPSLERFDNLELIKLFSSPASSYAIREPLGQVHEVDIYYRQNPENTSMMNFDFGEFLASNSRYKIESEHFTTLP